jgi:hypothetical protein
VGASHVVFVIGWRVTSTICAQPPAIMLYDAKVVLLTVGPRPRAKGKAR